MTVKSEILFTVNSVGLLKINLMKNNSIKRLNSISESMISPDFAAADQVLRIR